GAAQLAWSLGLNKTLIELRLDINAITDLGALELAAALYSHPILEKLSLSGNAIGDKGMKAFVKVLANNKTLLELNLRSNRVTDECMKDILRLLKRQGKLEFLDLRDNQLSEENNSVIIRTIDQLDVMRGQSQYGVEKLVSQVKTQNDRILCLETELSKITTDRISLGNQIQSLEEQLAFFSHLHQLEIETIQEASLSVDISAFYRSEIVRAVAAIRDDFSRLSKMEKAEIAEHYRTDIERKQMTTNTAEDSVASRTSRQSLLKLINLICQMSVSYTRLQGEHVTALKEYQEFAATLHMMKKKNAILINNQDMEIRELEASIMYLTDQYCQTKLKSAYLQVEVNTYRNLIQMKFPH
ncbi:unnamed protein product, partial [Adineta ricciae]